MKRTKYPIHKDFRKWSHLNPKLDKRSVGWMQKLMRILFEREESDQQVLVSRFSVPSEEGVQVPVLMYTPRNLEMQEGPCLIDIHGGGFVIPAAPHHYKLAREYALRAGCRVLFPNYRLAPKDPYPAAPEDCFAVYRWALRNSDLLKIDPEKIAVGGDSAGGELAAAVSVMAAENELTMPVGQMLLYPCTGRGLHTESEKLFTDTPMCNSKDMALYDGLYMQSEPEEGDVHASPIDYVCPEQIPPTYVETAEFDCLRDQGILYAKKLKEAGVPVRLHRTKGTIHGYDIELKSSIVRESVDLRVKFLRLIFADRTAKEQSVGE